MAVRAHNPTTRLLMDIRAKIKSDPGIADHELKQEAIAHLEPSYQAVLTLLWNERQWGSSAHVATALGIKQQRAGEILFGMHELGLVKREKRWDGLRWRWCYRAI